MAGIDLSDYQQKTNTKSILLAAPPVDGGKKRKLIYLVIIFICVAGMIYLFKDIDFGPQPSVEETLPPGVPLEAPPLDQLPEAAQ